MNIQQLREIIDRESPTRIEIGTVVGADPRGMRTTSVRLSGGRVCARAHSCVDDLEVGDKVMVVRSKDVDRVVVLGKVLDEYFEVKLFDDDDNEVAAGEIGEIVVRPKMPYIMMTEYYNMPDKTLETYRNLWFHTGDFAKKDADDFFIIPQHNFILFRDEIASAHACTNFFLVGDIQFQISVKTVKIGYRHQNPGTHFGHEMGIDEKGIARESAVYGSFEMMGQRAVESE